MAGSFFGGLASGFAQGAALRDMYDDKKRDKKLRAGLENAMTVTGDTPGLTSVARQQALADTYMQYGDDPAKGIVLQQSALDARTKEIGRMAEAAIRSGDFNAVKKVYAYVNDGKDVDFVPQGENKWAMVTGDGEVLTSGTQDQLFRTMAEHMSPGTMRQLAMDELDFTKAQLGVQKLIGEIAGTLPAEQRKSMDAQRQVFNTVYQMANDELQRLVDAKAPPEMINRAHAAVRAIEQGYRQTMGVGGGSGGGGSSTMPTKEFVNGQWVTVNDSFRSYQDPVESARDWLGLMSKPRYSDVMAADSLEEAITAQSRSGYATDPAYGDKLRSIQPNTEEKAAFLNARKQELLAAGATPALAELGARQAALESGWGRSGLSRQHNNYFGIKGSSSDRSAPKMTYGEAVNQPKPAEPPKMTDTGLLNLMDEIQTRAQMICENQFGGCTNQQQQAEAQRLAQEQVTAEVQAARAAHGGLGGAAGQPGFNPATDYFGI